MAQENILLAQPNFCIAPLVGTFATIDTTQINARFIIKNSSGVPTVSYTFNPNITQNTNIYYFDYIGPRNVSSLVNGMVFITMESDTTSSVIIKKWNLDKSNTRLNLDYTITKNTSGNEYIKSVSMAAGRYYTNLSVTTISGTGQITLNNTDTIVSGTRLYIGPSTNISYINAYEEVIATSVSGTTVFIRNVSGLATPLTNYYNVGDPVTYLGDFYLFSDIGVGNDTTKGALLKIDNYTGITKSYHNSALYNSVTTANYGIPYYNTVGVVKDSELLYVDVTNYSIQKSVRLNVTRPFSSTLVKVHAIAFTLSSVYRLQLSKVSRSDTGDYAELTWTTYNYHEDAVARYSDNITVYTDPIAVIGNQKTITLVAIVRDQYGIALSGKTVTFAKVYGDVIGTWGEVNKQGITDINGIAKITYTSGWYDPSLATNINEDIKISAKTDGSNILTGSVWIWTTLVFRLNAKFILGSTTTPDMGAQIITQKNNIFSATDSELAQKVSFSSAFVLTSYSKFKMPGGHETYQNLTVDFIIQQRRQFSSILNVNQTQLLNSTLAVTQTNRYTGTFPISQTYVSRHLPTGSNKDNVNIAQFKFIIDAVPTPFSIKNNVNSIIWLKLAPYGFNLNKSTLTFRVREYSYTGDTDFVDYTHTPNLSVVEFDAGGGLIGLEVLYTPLEYFHNSAIIYVYLEVYDVAIPPNRIEFDYWFSIVADYKAPFIINEFPSREQREVAVFSNIQFDILDTEVGVDINTLEFYIDNRSKDFLYEVIDGGYRVTHYNTLGFYYTQPVEISIKVADASEEQNVLYDMWRFYCTESLPPIIDPESFYPKTCFRGFSTRTTKETFSIYDSATGIDIESIKLLVDGIERPIVLTPIIRRIK